MTLKRPPRLGRKTIWRRLAGAVAAMIVIGSMTALVPRGASADVAPPSSSLVGSQGTQTVLAPTTSAVTVSAASVLGSNSPFADLSLTVNQTTNLVNQSVSVSWAGATPTDADQNGGFHGQFKDNYLQIFQCWSSPGAAGPSPEQCEFGGAPLWNGGTPPAYLDVSQGGVRDVVTREMDQSFPGTSATGPLPPTVERGADGGLWVPFDGVDGTVTVQESNDNVGLTGTYWLNQDFNAQTTNEDPLALTHQDGTGEEKFTVDTGVEAPGLGCGQSAEAVSGRTVTPKCWLVVVPRGSPSQEDPPDSAGLHTGDVTTSPLSPQAWANHIAIPLSFDPVGSSCALASNSRRMVGSESAAPAVQSWESTLCATPGTAPYQYSLLPEDSARQQVTAPPSGLGAGPGLGVVSRPVNPSVVDPADPVTYAPLSLSGVVIAFNIERTPAVTAEDSLQGVPVEHLYLTPRLVAKLLTESYLDQFYIVGKSLPATGYKWVTKNPANLLADPEFLKYNPEFSLLFDDSGTANRDSSSLVVEEPTSDEAHELWQWVLADPTARSWLAGSPDQWGMKVNPWYDTNAKTNPGGIGFGNPIPESYPKSDPYQYQETLTDIHGVSPPMAALPRALGMDDWNPYVNNLQTAALDTSAANDGAKVAGGSSQQGVTPDTYWVATGAEPPGATFILSITDTADAARYGLQMASLSAAGDDTNPTFVAPDVTGLLAGEGAMEKSAASGVLAPSVSTPGTYPLTTLNYAVVAPLSLTAPERKDYARFISYATGLGQTTGTSLGQLPLGYAPLPAALRAQATAVVHTILTEAAPATPTTTIATTTTSTTSTTTASTPPVFSGGDTSFPDTSPPIASPTTTSAPVVTASSTTVEHRATRIVPRSTGVSGRKALAPVVLATSRTPGVSVGAVRFVLPITLCVGAAAALAARWLGIRRRKSNSEPVP